MKKSILIYFSFIFIMFAGAWTVPDVADEHIDNESYHDHATYNSIDGQFDFQTLSNFPAYNLTYGGMTRDDFTEMNSTFCLGDVGKHDLSCFDYTRLGSYTGYGNSNIFFWIDPNFSENVKNEIRNAASAWNSVYMHDGVTNNIVNFQEVYSTNDINGRKILKIERNDSHHTSGTFYPGSMSITMRSNGGLRTPTHEFGHVLGLGDMDGYGGYNIHLTLMGYRLGGYDIWYQDIQGAAIYSGKHTVHDYRRYVLDNGVYSYKCFYCDRNSAFGAIIPSTAEWKEESNCSHSNQKLVISSLTNHWYRCVDCYKIFSNNSRHSMKIEYNNFYHYEICTVCNIKYNETQHDLYIVNHTYHRCNGCDVYIFGKPIF